MTDKEIPTPQVDAPRADPSRKISAVWLVPLLALVVSLGVAWQTFSGRGPTIEITFANAAGIEAGQTLVRFRDVTVGLVEAVRFSEDLGSVIVTVRLEREMAQYADADAQFWVVRPSVTAQGITGIETVISGVYIQVYWDAEIGEPETRFTALPSPPLTPADQPGMRVRLRAPDGGSVTVGAPVLYKRIQVGQVEAIELTDAGDVLIDIFVDAPNHLRLTRGARFWNASGFDVSLGPAGASLNVESLISLLQGGIAFDTLGSDVTPVAAGHVYPLFDSPNAARESIFSDDISGGMMLSVYFDDSVRGLEPGAAVEYRGIRVGEVTAIDTAILDSEDGGRVALRTTLAIAPERLGVLDVEGADLEAEALDLLENEVSLGLRAQLAYQSIISQSLYVDLSPVEDAEPAALDRDAEPYPALPSVSAEISGIVASAEGVMQRIGALPFEDVVDGVVTLLANVNTLITDEGVRNAPANLGLLLADLRTLVAESGLQDAPGEINAILASARAVIDELAAQELAASLALTLDSARAAIDDIGVATAGLPALVDELQALSGEARDLPIEELAAAANSLIRNVDAIVQSDGVAALPATLDASLGEARALLSDIRAGGGVENASAALASVRAITEELAAARLVESIRNTLASVEETAASVDAASEDLPVLIEDLRELARTANELPVEELVASGTRVLQSADAFLTDQGARDLPASLGAALDEFGAALAELREGGAVASVNSALGSADEAAQAIRDAAASLPALAARLALVADRADLAIGAFTPGSDINRDTQILLREVREAARAVNDLARALERRPNSILFGR